MSINFNHVTNDITASSGSVSINGSVPSGTTLTLSNKTGAYTVVAGDAGKIINCTSGTFTVALTAAATLGSGFNVTIWNTSTGVITIDPNGAETIDGKTTFALKAQNGLTVVSDGTNWYSSASKLLQLYNECVPINANITIPNATGFGAVAIGSNAKSSGQYSLALGQGSNASNDGGIAIGFATASGANSISVCNATGLFNTVASATNSTAIGGNSGGQGSQAVTGSGATALSGSYASGTDSLAAAIANNTSTYGALGTNSIAIGRSAKASVSNSTCINKGTASGAYSLILSSGNVGATASDTGSIAVGDGQSLTKNKYAIGWGYLATAGDSQSGLVICRQSTTDATATVLTTDGAAVAATNQLVLPNNSAYAFTGTVVARQQAAGGTASAAWKVEGLIRREGTAASTTLVASTVTAISNVPGWTLALSADTTNGGLAVTATGAAATNIRWVGTIQTSEVTYA